VISPVFKAGRAAPLTGALFGRFALVTLFALVGLVAACGSSTHGRTGAATGGTSTAAPSTAGSVPATTAAPAPASAPVTTAVGQLPTVPNCGGGAYEPKTLLIVCGTGTTMATGVSWRSWAPAGASGSGTVHLQVNGRPLSAPAALLLSDVVNGPVGPQFTVLTVTWTGTPPDGNAKDTYHLKVVG
jgi:hypothetical protein